MPPVLQMEGLRTEFRMRNSAVVAVDGVSIEVEQGECVGIVGESGCGKTTTGLSIMRLLPGNGHITGGTVTLLGRDLAGLDEKEMRNVRGDEVALIPSAPSRSSDWSRCRARPSGWTSIRTNCPVGCANGS
jgi:ABC-type dipeptide/oligopeptide/nickel transport system ATPase component